MESSFNRYSNEFLTKLSLTTEILPFYGHADQCRQLMTQFRRGSRNLWNENLNKWFNVLSSVKQTVIIDSSNVAELNFIAQNHRYAMCKLNIQVGNLNNLDNLSEFIKGLADPSMLEIEAIILETSKHNKDYELLVPDLLKIIDREDLMDKIEKMNFLKCEVIQLPDLFRFKTDHLPYTRINEKKFMIESTVIELTSDFEIAKDPEATIQKIVNCDNLNFSYSNFVSEALGDTNEIRYAK